MKWILVFYLANPADYQAHSAYLNAVDCVRAEQRYRDIFQQTNSTLQAQCRARNRTVVNRQGPITISRYQID